MSSSDCNGSKGKKPVIFQLPCYISAILDFDEALRIAEGRRLPWFTTEVKKPEPAGTGGW
jgi:hypothetical protein